SGTCSSRRSTRSSGAAGDSSPAFPCAARLLRLRCSREGRTMTARALNVLLGTWLLFATWILPRRVAGPQLNDFWTGLGIVVAALVSASVPTFRFVNTFLGAWLVAAPFLIGAPTLATTVNDACVGALVMLLSLVPDELEDRIGRRLVH